MFFSANVGEDKKLELCAVLGVHNGITKSNYLGLPSLVGRSKKRVFGFLKERASIRIQGWQKKPISRAGKTILIRNVAQSIPSYCMSCFLLPKTLCQELERKFNNYWWSSGAGGRRSINWLSWNNVSMSKRKGGLGFRNLYGFNIALMGKHCWRFMQDPNALVSRVYKARYFPDSHPLRAVKGHEPSFIWSGIWAAKEELLSGFRWVIGDGNDIRATTDPWLRMKSDFRVERSHIYEGRNEVVSNYFLPNSKLWDISRVQAHFLQEDAKAILAIQVPQCNIRDRVVWANSTDGFYSAKAGYHLWHALNIGTNDVPQGEGWGKIWRLLLPHKVKIFIWRLCRNTVPVRRRLSSKGVDVTWICPMCNRDIEHLGHVFFDCDFATQCWNTVGIVYDMSTVDQIPEWLLQKLASAPAEEVIKICVVLWGIWFWRNKKVWEGKSVSAGFAMEGSFRMVNEWKEAKRKQVAVSSSSRSKPQKYVCRWKPPEEDTLEVNVDASIYPGSETFSIGMLIRNLQGSF